MRPFTLSDLEEYYTHITSDPEVMRYIGQLNGIGAPLTKDETLGRIEKMIAGLDRDGFGMLALIERKEKRLIGRCGLCYLDGTSEVEVGYLLAKQAWGKGYATEAAQECVRFGFSEKRLDHIVGITYPKNIASRHVLEKLGMKEIGYSYNYSVHCVKYEKHNDMLPIREMAGSEAYYMRHAR